MALPDLATTHDLVLAGTGFASTFFAHEYLAHAPASARVLFLERGELRSHAWQLAHRDALLEAALASIENPDVAVKPWRFALAHGGSSNCWIGNTPRMLPEDFELRSRYGVASDWPVGYAELEPWYAKAEALLDVAGPDNTALYPRSTPYPQPPHRMQAPDRALAEAFPGQFFALPTARASRPTPTRAACCGSMSCTLCPVEAKFTILNGMRAVFDDPRVRVVHGARVRALEIENGRARAAVFEHGGGEQRVRGDFFALGANAIFNPVILAQSGLAHPELGRGLVEQASVMVHVLLRGMQSFDGATIQTGHGYMLYGGAHRSERAAGLIETHNRPELRMERGRWREILRFKVIVEDLRRPENRVDPTGDPERVARTTWTGISDYAQRTFDALPRELESVLAKLPVERIEIARELSRTESHSLGTALMGVDPETSVVDADLVHHRVRNLAVVGGSAFPTAAPANPTLSLCALSLRSARRIFGQAP
jgi:choline dehydrogenase-like flavoprotein